MSGSTFMATPWNSSYLGKAAVPGRGVSVCSSAVPGLFLRSVPGHPVQAGGGGLHATSARNVGLRVPCRTSDHHEAISSVRTKASTVPANTPLVATRQATRTAATQATERRASTRDARTRTTAWASPLSGSEAPEGREWGNGSRGGVAISPHPLTTAALSPSTSLPGPLVGQSITTTTRPRDHRPSGALKEHHGYSLHRL